MAACALARAVELCVCEALQTIERNSFQCLYGGIMYSELFQVALEVEIYCNSKDRANLTKNQAIWLWASKHICHPPLVEESICPFACRSI